MGERVQILMLFTTKAQRHQVLRLQIIVLFTTKYTKNTKIER